MNLNQLYADVMHNAYSITSSQMLSIALRLPFRDLSLDQQRTESIMAVRKIFLVLKQLFRSVTVASFLKLTYWQGKFL